MALEDSLSRVFSLPDQQQYAGGSGGGSRRGSGGGQSTYNDEYFGVGKMPEGLQYTDQVDQMSQQIFQRWNDLKNFAYSMQSMYGIDVTRPNGSPEAVAANQAFNQERANIQYEIDKLKESGKMAQQLNPMFAAGTISATDQYGQAPLATQMPQEAYNFTGLTEPSEKVISSLSKPFERSQDYNRAIAQGKAYVQSLRAQGRTREADDVEKALMPSVNVHYEKAGAGTNSPIGGQMTEWAQLVSGSHPSFSVTNVVGKGGSKFTESSNNPFTGKTFGKYTVTDANGNPVTKDFVINSFRKDNDTGTVYAVNEAGYKKAVDPSNIDISFREVLQGTGGLNEYENYLKQNANLFPSKIGQGGVSTKTVPANIFLSGQDLQRGQSLTSQSQSQKNQALAIQQDIDKSLKSLDEAGFWSNLGYGLTGQFSKIKPTTLQYDTEEGSITVEKLDGGYNIKLNGVSVRNKDNRSKLNKKELKEYFLDKNVIGYKLLDNKGRELTPVEPQVSQQQGTTIDDDI